jgi:hypothetical protein
MIPKGRAILGATLRLHGSRIYGSNPFLLGNTVQVDMVRPIAAWVACFALLLLLLPLLLWRCGDVACGACCGVQSQAFNGNPILETVDLSVPTRNMNIGVKVEGLERPSTVDVTLSKAAVANMNLDLDIQFRITCRTAKGEYWTNGNDGCDARYTLTLVHDPPCLVSLW